MEKNPLKVLQKYGQSIWLDNIRRGLITSGELKRRIDEDRLLGVTSNPTIFEKAIAGSRDYDEQLQRLVSEGKGSSEILDDLTIQDIQMAAGLFKPVYKKTKGEDGFVSIEVSPLLAHKKEETIEAAKEMHRKINRENVMIKVPATPEGIQACEELIGMGISINMTLIFSVETYEAIARAYIAGIKRRHKKGQPLGAVRSVASVFISQIDTLVDRSIAERIQSSKDPEKVDTLKSLIGKVTIANAKLIYQRFREIFQGKAFQELKNHGANLQRPLWASTGTKNPLYRDVLYIEELIGQNTVNTVPPTTLNAFRDHGKVRPSLEEDLEGAMETMKKLDGLGIDIKEITRQLQETGVKSFAASYKKLTDCITAKRQMILAGGEERFSTGLGPYEASVRETLQSLDQQDLPERIWAGDPTLWKENPMVQTKIKNRLGWLTVTETMTEEAEEVMVFARSVKDAGLTDIVLLGMGGSSLCPEVLRKTFGVAPGYPNLIVLDTTDPATILHTERGLDLKRTLFLLASKSGTTIEMQSLYRYFVEKIRAIEGGPIGDHFIAITDPGTPLEHLAEEERFRKVFLNPADIGGRYSALSYFGLVPAALIGIDLVAFLDRAEEMVQGSVSCIDAKDNPGIKLGAILGALGKAGRDKVTFITSETVSSFGLWAEQLIAESTGKEGKGLVPVASEPVGDPDVYGDDRLFVYLRVDTAPDKVLDQKVDVLQKAGYPVVRIRLRDNLDLAGEFFRWELATAVAGVILGINPFDEPNVSESKANTAKVLEGFQKTGSLDLPTLGMEEGGLGLVGDLKTGITGILNEALIGFLEQSGPQDYVALMVYVAPSEVHEALLQLLRRKIRDRYRIATTLGYGPRFLHSTGQLHKGGAGNGIFLQITARDNEDISIPGSAYSFGVLKRSQALGDFHSLTGRGLRVLEIRLGENVEAGLKRLL